jgi:hypothetical protein
MFQLHTWPSFGVGSGSGSETFWKVGSGSGLNQSGSTTLLELFYTYPYKIKICPNASMKDQERRPKKVQKTSIKITEN